MVAGERSQGGQGARGDTSPSRLESEPLKHSTREVGSEVGPGRGAGSFGPRQESQGEPRKRVFGAASSSSATARAVDLMTHMLGSGAYPTTTCGVPQELCGLARGRIGKSYPQVRPGPIVDLWTSRDGPGVDKHSLMNSVQVAEPCGVLGLAWGLLRGDTRRRQRQTDPQLLPRTTPESSHRTAAIVAKEISFRARMPGITLPNTPKLAHNLCALRRPIERLVVAAVVSRVDATCDAGCTRDRAGPTGQTWQPTTTHPCAATSSSG